MGEADEKKKEKKQKRARKDKPEGGEDPTKKSKKSKKAMKEKKTKDPVSVGFGALFTKLQQGQQGRDGDDAQASGQDQPPEPQPSTRATEKPPKAADKKLQSAIEQLLQEEGGGEDDSMDQGHAPDADPTAGIPTSRSTFDGQADPVSAETPKGKKKKKQRWADSSRRIARRAKAEQQQRGEAQQQDGAEDDDPTGVEAHATAHVQPPASRSQAGAPTAETNTVFVNQIPYSADEEDVRAHFQATSVRLLRHKNGQSKGIAFVEMGSSDAVQVALSLHGSKLAGRKINVQHFVDRNTAREQYAEKRKRRESEEAEAAVASGRLTDDKVRALVSDCVRKSKGAVKVSDVDSRCLDFIANLEEPVARAALRDFATIPAVRENNIKNKASYLMGVLRKHSTSGADAPGTGAGAGSSGGQDPAAAAAKKPKPKSQYSSSNDEAEKMIVEAIQRSGGKLRRGDFDDRHVSFLRELDPEVAREALTEYASSSKLDTIQKRGPYFMGILKRHATGGVVGPSGGGGGGGTHRAFKAGGRGRGGRTGDAGSDRKRRRKEHK